MMTVALVIVSPGFTTTVPPTRAWTPTGLGRKPGGRKSAKAAEVVERRIAPSKTGRINPSRRNDKPFMGRNDRESPTRTQGAAVSQNMWAQDHFTVALFPT